MNRLEKLGLGTAAIGRPSYINIKKEDKTDKFSKDNFRQNGIQLIEKAYENGIRYFDTAPGYGMAEQMLKDWLNNKNDTSIELASKWGYTYVADFNPNATVHEIKEHSLKKLNEQWSSSKELLPSLTSYQIHSATFETGVFKNESVLNRLAQLKDEYGIIIGITTTGANQVEVLEKALDIKVNGSDLFDLFQVTYNIFDQSINSISHEIAERNKRLVIKEALANGRVFPNLKYPHYAKAFMDLKRLAEKYHVGIDAIALRFCIDSIPTHKVLSGAATFEHLLGNLKIADFKLDHNDILRLKDLATTSSEYWKERKELAWN